MNEPAFQQQAERVRTGMLWLVAVALVLVSAGLIAIAWWLVIPQSPSLRPTAPSPLERVLFQRATTGDDIRAAGERELETYGWVDRRAGVVRVPIDRAIDAVVADPRLIGTGFASAGGAGSGGGEIGR